MFIADLWFNGTVVFFRFGFCPFRGFSGLDKFYGIIQPVNKLFKILTV